MRVSLKKLLFLVTVLVCGFYFLLWIYEFQTPSLFELQKTYDELKVLFENNTSECNFYADPYDPRIAAYINPPHEPVNCAPKQANLTFITGQRLRLVDDTTKGCEFRYFWHNSGVDDFSVKYGEWKPLDSGGVELEHDFVDVSCRGTFGLEVYRYQHATVVEKNVSIESGKKFKEESEDSPSVQLYPSNATIQEPNG
uniref:Uncharacterized protein n=1 Tax=Panagrolaimus sp. JU765 TaxID=591449 RepID=A0AC34RFE0_9BILA